MSDHVFGMFDMGLVGVVVLALAVWQLVSMHRETRRDKPGDKPRDESSGD